MQVKISLKEPKHSQMIRDLVRGHGIILENVENKEDAQSVLITLFNWEEIKDK
jgi:hypothetical protein